MELQSNKSPFFRLTQFSSGLVIRVFTASLFCLIIPLILYSLVAVQTDYNTTKEQLNRAQLAITKDKIHLLEQVIEIEFAAMAVINRLILDKNVTVTELTELLHGFADGTFVAGTYYVDPNGKVIASSSQTEVIDFSTFIEANHLKSCPEKIFVATDPSGQTGLFLSQTVYGLSDTGIQGFLFFDLHSEWLVSTIFLIRSIHNADVVLIDHTNTIIASAQKNWVGQKIPNIPTGSVHTILYQGKEYLSVIEPVDDSNFSLVNLIDKKNLFTPLQKNAIQFVVLLLIIIAVGASLILFFLSRLSEPIHRIQEAMQKVSEGDLTFTYKPMKLGFEINVVGEMFNETVRRLIVAMEAAKQAQIKEEVYRNELALGHEVQKSLLPTISPHLDCSEVAGKFIPSKEVGGDFYDLMCLRSHRDLLVMADTAGKGVMACLYSLNLRSLLRAFCEAHDRCEEMILSANNMLLKDTRDSGMFITAWVGIYNHETKEIEYASMGHPPAILKHKNGQIEMLSTQGIAFGAMILDHIEVKKITVTSGDILFLYTDGLIEAMNEKGEYYGLERLISFIRGIQVQNVDQMVEMVYENIQQFCGNKEQFDDLTLMATHYL